MGNKIRISPTQLPHIYHLLPPICEQLGIEKEEVTLDTTFDELGADSLDLFQIVIELEEKYEIQIEEVENLKTIKDAVNYVESHKEK